MKAAIYCRVSTEGQEQDGTSLQTQLEACLKYCHERDYEVGYQFKEAYSGLSLERPKLNELRELVRSDEVDVVVVYSLDRFSRDPVHGVILMQELDKRGISLEAATETVDNSEVGKLVFYIKGYAAKLYAERRRDATTRGKKALLKAGKIPNGCGSGIYGYELSKEFKKRIPVEKEAKVVKRIFEMIVSGMPAAKVAKILNEEGIPTKTGKQWRSSLITKIIRNPAYIGITYYGMTKGKDHKKVNKEDWILLPDATPAIISKELFDQAQAVKDKTKKLYSNKTIYEYPLRGFAVCGECESPLVGTCLNKKHRYYKCSGTYNTYTRSKICDAKLIPADMLEDAVWQKVKSVLANPELLLSEVGKQTESEKAKLNDGNIEQEIRELNRNLKKYAEQQRRLAKAFKLGFDPDIILDEINQTKKEKKADESRLAVLIETKENIIRISDYEDKLRELCARIVPDLDNCNNQNKKEAYTYLDLKVKATPEAIDIKGYIQPKVCMAAQTSG
jgi:site-specific DNA recombinase